MGSKETELAAAAMKAAEVQLNDWDIVNAGTFTAVNSGIVDQASTPAHFDLPNPPMGLPILKGDWNTWRLVSGSTGKTIAIEMPIKSGNASILTMPLKYATLDSSTKGNVSLSGNGLSLTAVAGIKGPEAAFSTVTAAKSKFYFEIRNDQPTPSGGRAFVGLAADIDEKQRFYNSPTAYAFRSDGGVLTNSAADAFAAPPGDIKWDNKGDTVGVAVDLEEGKVWFRGRDGSWLGSGADPDTGAVPAFTLDTAKEFYIAAAVDPDAAATINLDGKGWAYKTPLPDGYVPGLIDIVGSSTNTNLAGGLVSATISFKQVKTSTPANKLMVEDVGTVATPAVSVGNVTLQNGTAAPGPVEQAFDVALNTQIAKFVNVFHIIDASKQVEKTMTWMKPTETDYAAADLKDATGKVEKSVLAILNKTEANKSKMSMTPQVDPAIIANLPVGSDAVVAISAERLTEQILLPGAIAMSHGATKDDFEITDLNRKVKNKRPMSFGKIQLNHTGKNDLIVDVTIPKGGMIMSIEGRTILVEYAGLSFDYPNMSLGKQEQVTFGFDQRMYLESKKRSDGHHVLFPTLDDPKNPQGKGATGMSNFRISMNLSPQQKVKDKEDGTSYTGLIIGCVIGGVLILAGAGAGAYWLCADAGEAAAADGGGAAVVAGGGAANVAVQGGIYAAFPAAAADVYDVVDANAMYDQIGDPLALFALPDGNEFAAAKPSSILPAGAMPFKARWAIGFSHLMTMAGADTASDMGMSKADIKKFAEGNFDVLGIETTVEKFVEAALRPFDWPQSKDWQFIDAELNGSLLIYGKIITKKT